MLILFFIWLEVLKMPIKRNLILSGSNATHGIDKKRLTVDQVEEIAKQHTLHSAIASEFQDFTEEEKALFVTLIYTALEQAIESGKPISASTRYLVMPVIYNSYLAHVAKEEGLSPLKVLTYVDLYVGTKRIFEKSLKYHAYVDHEGEIEKSLAICQARFVPSYSLTKDNGDIKEIGLDICVTIVRELNAILEKSQCSMVKALSLTNQLLNPIQKNEKDVN